MRCRHTACMLCLATASCTSCAGQAKAVRSCDAVTCMRCRGRAGGAPTAQAAPGRLLALLLLLGWGGEGRRSLARLWRRQQRSAGHGRHLSDTVSSPPTPRNSSLSDAARSGATPSRTALMSWACSTRPPAGRTVELITIDCQSWRGLGRTHAYWRPSFKDLARSRRSTRNAADLSVLISTRDMTSMRFGATWQALDQTLLLTKARRETLRPSVGPRCRVVSEGPGAELSHRRSRRKRCPIHPCGCSSAVQHQMTPARSQHWTRLAETSIVRLPATAALELRSCCSDAPASAERVAQRAADRLRQPLGQSTPQAAETS